MVLSHHHYPGPVKPWDNGPSIGTERMVILGSLKTESFLPWIGRHAAKLGLAQRVDHADTDRIELTVAGPAELIDALEMGCSLGPIDVWVDEIQRVDAAG